MSEPTTLRESLEAVIGGIQEAPEPAPEPVEESSSAPEPEVQSEPVAESEPQQQTQAPAADLNQLAEQDKPQAAKQKKDGIVAGPKSGPKAERAPTSWRPEVREHWAKLPESVRAEVIKRENEVQRTLKDTVEARQFADAISRTFAPYEAYIKAENATPLQVIDNLMGTAVRLRTSTGPELAQMMAGMVKQFGTGRFGDNFIEMLDSALAGQTPRVDPGQAQLQQSIQQQLAPVQQFMQQFQQAQAQQSAEISYRAQNEVEQFLSNVEFGEDVREEMADLMEMASKRGQELSLSEAYKQACMINPTVRSALVQRSKTKQAQNQSAVAQRARAAAVSVPSSGPSMAPRMESTDIRSAIEAAIAMNSR